jgi:hypothetical protein
MSAGQGKTGGQMIEINTPLPRPDARHNYRGFTGTSPFAEVGCGRRRVANVARSSGSRDVARDQTRLRCCVGATMATDARGCAYAAVVECSLSRR